MDVFEWKKQKDVIYLKNRNFECFIHAWYQKYYSLGHLGGKISIEDLKKDEIDSLNGLLGDFIINKKIEISYVQLMKCLN